MNEEQCIAVSRIESLLDIVGRHLDGRPTVAWWGPVIGSDDPPIVDGIDRGFQASLVQDDTTPSDAGLKRNVKEVGKTVYGLTLCHFQYLNFEAVYEGVLAQEVLEVKPSAVFRGADGFLRVNYSDLGLEMRRVA